MNIHTKVGVFVLSLSLSAGAGVWLGNVYDSPAPVSHTNVTKGQAPQLTEGQRALGALEASPNLYELERQYHVMPQFLRSTDTDHLANGEWTFTDPDTGTVYVFRWAAAHDA